MVYTDPSTLEFVLNENPLQSAKLNQATNDQFLALFPDEDTGADWSPGLAATTTGATITVTGRQYRVGAMMHLWANFVIGVSGGSGTYYVELPASAVGLAVSASEGSGQPIGSWTLRDNSVPQSYTGVVELRTLDRVQFNAGPGLLSNTFPMQIQQDDELSFYCMYPAA